MTERTENLLKSTSVPPAMFPCACSEIPGKDAACGQDEYEFVCYDPGQLLLWPFKCLEKLPPGWYSEDCLKYECDEFDVGDWTKVCAEIGVPWDEDDEDFCFNLEEKLFAGEFKEQGFEIVTLGQWLKHEIDVFTRGGMLDLTLRGIKVPPPYYPCGCKDCGRVVKAECLWWDYNPPTFTFGWFRDECYSGFRHKIPSEGDSLDVYLERKKK